MIKFVKVDSECAVLDEGKTRRWNRIGQEKDKLAKNCSTRKQELEWKTLTEAKQLARVKTSRTSKTTIYYPKRICKAR